MEGSARIMQPGVNGWRYSRTDLATPAITEPTALRRVQHEISDSRNGDERDDGQDLQPAWQQEKYNKRRNTANDPTSTFRQDSLRDIANIILAGRNAGWPWCQACQREAQSGHDVVLRRADEGAGRRQLLVDDSHAST